MSNIDNLRRKILGIQNQIQQEEIKIRQANQKKNTTARMGRYSGGKVTINGNEYDCYLASRDIVLVDGCTVYCLPTASGNMSIIGGGVV